MHTKSENEAYHFKLRLQERYGLQINRKVYREMCQAARKANILRNQSLRISVRKIEYIGIEIYVIYDKQRKRLVTCLTEDQYDNPKNSCLQDMYNDL